MKLSILITLMILGACAKPSQRVQEVKKENVKKTSPEAIASELSRCEVEKDTKISIKDSEIVFELKPHLVEKIKKINQEQLWTIEDLELKTELNLKALEPVINKKTNLTSNELLKVFSVATNFIKSGLENFKIQVDEKKSVVFITSNKLDLFKITNCHHQVEGVVLPTDLKDELDILSYTQCHNEKMSWNLVELTSGEFFISEQNGIFLKQFNFDESKDLYRNGWFRKHYNFKDSVQKYDLEIIKKSLIGKLSIKGLQRSAGIDIKEELKCELFESK